MMTDLKPIFIQLSSSEIIDRMKSMDNIRAFHQLNEFIILTEPLNYLKRYQSAVWLFDWIKSDLEAGSDYIQYVNISVKVQNGNANVRSECEHGSFRSGAQIPDVNFPLHDLKIRAAYEWNFWHLSINF